MARISGTTLANVLRGSAQGDEIFGLAGNDRLYGRSGHDDIYGGRGNDQLFGGLGRDDLDGGSGDDSLFGGAGNDEIDGGSGNDVLSGGEGADRFEFERGDGIDIITDFQNGTDKLKIEGFDAAAIQAMIAGAQQVNSDVVLTLAPGTAITLQNFRLADLDLSDFVGLAPTRPEPPVRGREIDGTNGNDVLTGGAGNDEIDGLRGNDQLRGAAGNDEIDGDSGNDSLWGEDGRDDLDGGSGNDVLHGGAGNDTLDGERGNDLLTGGLGADRFEFERGHGRDIITDFQNGIDRIELDDFSRAQAQAVINSAQQVGADLLLTLSADTTITINNMQRAQLDMSDIVL